MYVRPNTNIMPKATDTRAEIFANLFAESRDALHRYIRRFVGSSETTKEIVQEAFLRTYRQGESVRTLRAFLFSTARNLAANEYRHQRTVEKGALGEIAASSVESKCESIEAEILRDEQNRLVQEAIDRLPLQCRAAFTLRIFHQCCYKEIAERLEISVKTVEKHIARGLKDTHSYLQRRYETGRPDRG